MLELPQRTTEIFDVFFLSLPLLVQLLTLRQLCQIESENTILHKFTDMITENFKVELRKVIT